MVKMSGGEALTKSLVKEGVEVVFGIPGIQIYGIVAAIRDEPGLGMVTTRHEQAASYMADGYSRASGKPGVPLVVPGVGLYNAASGLATAYARSSPVLCVAGQIPRHQMGKTSEPFMKFQISRKSCAPSPSGSGRRSGPAKFRCVWPRRSDRCEQAVPALF